MSTPSQTGQNILALGDGNRIDARFSDLGNALVELREAITKADAPEVEKVTLVANIDTIQSQLATPEPSKGILRAAWDTVRPSATVAGCASLVGKVGDLPTTGDLSTAE